jgi:hypothetical protein
MKQLKRESAAFIKVWLIKNGITANKEDVDESIIRYSGPSTWKILLQNEKTIPGFNSRVKDIRTKLRRKASELNTFLKEHAKIFSDQLKNEPATEFQLKELHNLIGQDIPDIWNRIVKECELLPGSVIAEWTRLIKDRKDAAWSVIKHFLLKKKEFFNEPNLLLFLREAEKEEPTDKHILTLILKKIDTGKTVMEKLAFGRKNDLILLWEHIFQSIDPSQLKPEEKEEIEKLSVIFVS